MGQDLFDHRRIFDARDHLHCATTVRAVLDINLEHALPTLRPRHRHVVGWRGLSSRLGRAPAALGRRYWFTQPVIRRKDAVVARQVEAWRRHQGRQPGDKISGLDNDVRRALPVRGLEAVPNIPLRHQRQSRGRDRRTRDISVQAFPLLSFVCRARHPTGKEKTAARANLPSMTSVTDGTVCKVNALRPWWGRAQCGK